MKGLNSNFDEPDYSAPNSEYRLLPMRFLRLDATRRLVTGMAGDYAILPDEAFNQTVMHRLPSGRTYDNLKARHLIADSDSNIYQELLAAKIRTKYSQLPDFTSLHHFVVTLRCDHSCQYSEMSRGTEDHQAFDMTEEIASRAIELMLRSPSPLLKVEFQGGESLLNFTLVQWIVEEVKKRGEGRPVEFVVTSNLSPLTPQILDFAEKHQIHFSTSLDGPMDLHKANRPKANKDSWQRTIEGIREIRRRLGHQAVTAFMTSTAGSLEQPEAIIDEYIRQGFDAIFLRYISPYGFAARAPKLIGDETERFIEFYKRGLAHIISLNQSGTRFVEGYAQLLLRRILTVFPTSCGELQSPSGAGFTTAVYNYDGGVYASDEGRMMAEMGDQTFQMGTVFFSYRDLFLGYRQLGILFSTMSEGIPQCSSCALQPYCGTDPVFHYHTQGNFIGHRPSSSYCRRNMEIMRHLFLLLEDDPASAKVLKSWI